MFIVTVSFLLLAAKDVAWAVKSSQHKNIASCTWLISATIKFEEMGWKVMQAGTAIAVCYKKKKWSAKTNHKNLRNCIPRKFVHVYIYILHSKAYPLWSTLLTKHARINKEIWQYVVQPREASTYYVTHNTLQNWFTFKYLS